MKKEKLNWFNGKYMREMTDKEYLLRLKKFISNNMKGDVDDINEEKLKKILPIVRERIDVFYEFKEIWERGDFEYFLKEPSYELQNLKWRSEDEYEKVKKKLGKVKEFLENVSEDNFDAESIKAEIWDFASKEGRGEVLWPMRFALTGREKSPGPFLVSAILGKQESIKRIGNAIFRIENEDVKK